MFVKFNTFLILLAFVLIVFVSYISTQNSCQANRLAQVKSGQQKVRGTNLGSWLVMESYMAPHVWDQNGCDKNTAQGSYLLEKCLGNRAQSVMEKHWATFITEDDFAQMSSYGINTVRLPVGWWHIYDPMGGASKAKLNYYINPTDYVTGGLAYIDKAFEWAKKYGLGVLLDMHAAPGSQNGFDNSSPAENPAIVNWGAYPANVGQTVDSMELYSQRYGKHEALLGFCLLNEPGYVSIPTLQDYYKRAYTAVRKHSNDPYIVINPLIRPGESGTEPHWITFMNPDQGYKKVVMDLHYYSCFGGAPDQTNADGAINYIRWDRKYQIIDYVQKNPKPMLIGEWSACSHIPESRYGDFARIQADVYNAATMGWTFWSWTDGAPNNVWSLKTAFKYGWIDKIFPS